MLTYRVSVWARCGFLRQLASVQQTNIPSHVSLGLLILYYPHNLKSIHFCQLFSPVCISFYRKVATQVNGKINWLNLSRLFTSFGIYEIQNPCYGSTIFQFLHAITLSNGSIWNKRIKRATNKMDVIKVLKWVSARQRKKYVIDIWGAKGIEQAEALSGKTDRISASARDLSSMLTCQLF